MTGWRAEQEPEAMLPVLLSWFRRQLPASSCCRGALSISEWGGFTGFYPVHLRGECLARLCRGCAGKMWEGPEGMGGQGILANSALIGARPGPMAGGGTPPKRKGSPSALGSHSGQRRSPPPWDRHRPSLAGASPPPQKDAESGGDAEGGTDTQPHTQGPSPAPGPRCRPDLCPPGCSVW